MIYLATLSSRRFLPNFTPSKAAGCLSLRFPIRLLPSNLVRKSKEPRTSPEIGIRYCGVAVRQRF